MIDLLVLADMLILVYSGIVMSREVFDFLPVTSGMAAARKLHIIGSYWGFILMSFHLGIHWKMFVSASGKIVKVNITPRIRSAVCFLFGLITAAYGLYALISRSFIDYMFLKNEFVFMDFSESKLSFYLDYLAVMGLCIFAAHYLSKLIRKLSAKKERK